MKLAYWFFAVYLALSTPTFAIPICETATALEDDYCYTYIGADFQVMTGSKYGEISFAIRNLREIRDTQHLNGECDISFDNNKLYGKYFEVKWATSIANKAACVFSKQDAIEILSSMQKNSRYRLKFDVEPERSFYRDEAYPALDLGGVTEEAFLKEIYEVLKLHAEYSVSRTAYDPTETLNQIIDESLFDMIGNIFQ